MTTSRDDVDVSVLIPVLNEEQHLDATLRTMRAQEYDGRLEFVFADGGSTDGTRRILEAHAREDDRVVVVDNPARRTPHGLNRALARASGRYIARMDGHADYPTRYLALGVERLRGGDVQWVSGPQVPAGRGQWSSRVTLALKSWLGRGGSRRWAAEGDETALTSGSGVFLGVWERESLGEAGGWDEGWPVNQDVELLGRFEERGWTAVSLPGMAVDYVPRDSLRTLARQYFRYGFFRVKTSRRHPQALRRSHLGAPGLVCALSLLLAPSRKLRAVGAGAGGMYGLAVASATLEVSRPDHPADVVLLPAVFATMHLSWGLGFLAALLQIGLPSEGLLRVAGLGSQQRAR